MRTFVLLAAFSAQLLAISANGVAFKTSTNTCDSATSEKNCYATTDAGEACNWCSSAAVGASCYKASDAKSLPSSIFQCTAKLTGVTTCDSIKDSKTCMSSNQGTSSADSCSWCSSAAVGGTCFAEGDAKSLPSSVFSCEYQKHNLVASTCEGLSKDKCNTSKDSAGVKCAYCSSAAVGGTCFAETDAKTLPSSIYQCTYQKRYDGVDASTSCTGQKEKSCTTTVDSNGNKCAWCENAAVGNQCWTVDDAKSLPASIYSCTYPKAAYSATTSCTGQSSKTCTSTVDSNGNKCAFCKNAAVGDQCWTVDDAMSLPASIYSCTYPKAAYAPYNTAV